MGVAGGSEWPRWTGLSRAVRAGGRVDRVELKVLLDATLDEAAVLLGDRVRSPLLRTVHYLDTPDLALARHGVIVRVRTPRSPEGRVGADVVVKVCGPSRRSRGLYRELDALPGATRFTASLARTRGAAAASRALVAPCPAARLLSRTQRALVRSAAGGVVGDLDRMVVWGPVDTVRLRSRGGPDRVAVESWRFPDGSSVVELSAKCRPGRCGRVTRVLGQLVADGQVRPCRRQRTKTQLAFRAFGSGAASAARTG